MEAATNGENLYAYHVGRLVEGSIQGITHHWNVMMTPGSIASKTHKAGSAIQ